MGYPDPVVESQGPNGACRLEGLRARDSANAFSMYYAYIHVHEAM